MSEEKKTYINLILDAKEAAVLEAGKEHTGIKRNSDFMRFILRKFGNETLEDI